MDLKAMAKELSSLQSRLEKYEDLLISGTGDLETNREMLQYYRTETIKVREKYLEMVTLVKAELDRGV